MRQQKVIWVGLVRGQKCRVWSNGMTDRQDESGLFVRTGDENEIVASCVSQLLSAAEKHERLRKRYSPHI